MSVLRYTVGGVRRSVWLVVALALAVAVGASDVYGKVNLRYLGSSSVTSSRPMVFFYSDSLPRPKWIWLDVSANPSFPLSGSYSVSCSRGSVSRSVEFPITGVSRNWARPTVGRADSCNITAVVNYRDDHGGTITVNAYGGSRPKPKGRGRVGR